jgi:hypothetical protein
MPASIGRATSAFLGLLEGIGILPRVRLVDVVSDNRGYAPINVDLVLDIGNSRTCGVLVEESQDAPSLNNSQVLALRDLSRRSSTYARPFESRVEFAVGSFGGCDLAPLGPRQCLPLAVAGAGRARGDAPCRRDAGQ